MSDYAIDLFPGVCAHCGGGMDGTDVNVEAFEVTGLILCGECADMALDDGGFGDDDEGLTPHDQR